MNQRSTQNFKWGLASMWLVALTLVVLGTLAGCYMQTANDGTGDLVVHATLPVDFSIASLSGNGEIGALDAQGVPFVFAMVVDVDVFRQYRLDLEDFYHTLLLRAVFEADIYPVSTLEQLASNEWLDIEPFPAQTILETQFGSGVRAVAQEIGNTTSGNISFLNLPGGREYAVIVEVYRPEADDNMPGPGDYIRIVDARLSSVASGGTSTMALSLQQDSGILYDFVVNTIDSPIYAVLAGGGYVDFVIDDDGDISYGYYEVGGVAFEYRSRIAPGQHLHHIYIFEQGMQFDPSGNYTTDTLGAGRISAVDEPEKAFMELLLVTSLPLFDIGDDGTPNVSSTNMARARFELEGNWLEESDVVFDSGATPIFVWSEPVRLEFTLEDAYPSSISICAQDYDPSAEESQCSIEE